VNYVIYWTLLLADIPFLLVILTVLALHVTRLTAALTCHSLTVVNEGPTRLNYDGGQNKLDVLIEAEDGGH